MVSWTETQLRRLQELDASESDISQRFDNAAARENAFHELEKKQSQELRQRLKAFREIDLRPGLCRLETILADDHDVERPVAKDVYRCQTPAEFTDILA